MKQQTSNALPSWVTQEGPHQELWLPPGATNGIYVAALIRACVIEIPAAWRDYQLGVEIGREPMEKLQEQMLRGKGSFANIYTDSSQFDELVAGKLPKGYEEHGERLAAFAAYFTEWSGKYLRGSVLGSLIAMTYAGLDAQGVDVLALEEERLDVSGVGELLYGHHTKPVVQKRQREVKRQMRASGWELRDVGKFFWRAQVWVWREHLFDGSLVSAIEKRYMGTDNPFTSSKGDDRYSYWVRKMTEFNTALAVLDDLDR